MPLDRGICIPTLILTLGRIVNAWGDRQEVDFGIEFNYGVARMAWERWTKKLDELDTERWRLRPSTVLRVKLARETYLLRAE
jgi:hypothetical protein